MFKLSGYPYCPDCATAPSSGSGSQAKGLASIGLGIGGGLTLGGAIVYLATGAVSGPGEEILSSIAGFAALIMVILGLALGLIGKSEARGAGSPVALVGIAVNALMLTGFILLTVVGIVAGE